MNAPILTFRLDSPASHAFADLASVCILHAVETDDGVLVPEGTVGTVVAEWGGGAAYEVEFALGLATVEVSNLIAAEPR